jgi:hypothetical protein
MPVVYASFLLSALIGRWLQHRCKPARVALATLLGAIQFFLLTNFALWQFLDSYPHTPSGLLSCYVAGIPFFWNTLAGDAFYVLLFFGGFAFAQRMFPVLRESPVDGSH